MQVSDPVGWTLLGDVWGRPLSQPWCADGCSGRGQSGLFPGSLYKVKIPWPVGGFLCCLFSLTFAVVRSCEIQIYQFLLYFQQFGFKIWLHAIWGHGYIVLVFLKLSHSCIFRRKPTWLVLSQWAIGVSVLMFLLESSPTCHLVAVILWRIWPFVLQNVAHSGFVGFFLYIIQFVLLVLKFPVSHQVGLETLTGSQ